MTGADITTRGDELPRGLGLLSATALVIGEVIGVGIFLTPSEMAKSLGSPFWVFVVWGTMGLISVCGALCFGALAARFPEEGGGYVYLRRAYGPRVAFLFGWMSLLVTDPGITAMMAAGLARYAGSFAALSPFGVKFVAVGSILAMAAANILGVGIGAGILRGLSTLKLAVLVVIALWGFGFGLGSWSNFLPLMARPSNAVPLAPALIGGFMAAFFSMAGWWDASKIAGEVRDPGRNIPLALILGVGLVMLAYMIISGVFWYLVPLSHVDPERGFAAQAGEALFGPLGGKILAGIVILSVLGSLTGILMAAPRVYYAMARDRLFPSSLAAIHPKFGTPARATAIQALVASVLAASGSFEQILSYFMAVTITFLALMAAVVYLIPDKTGLGRVPGYPFTPIGFLIPVILVVILAVAGDPWRAGVGVGIVVLGLPVYEIFLPGGRASRRALPEAGNGSSTA
jgi:basic amino acid/polyamine antiporter, APA family